VLAKYFENIDEFPLGHFRGKRVYAPSRSILAFPSFDNLSRLELGSGTGVIGIVVALLGADVILTDLPVVLPLLQANVTANVGSSSHARVAPLRWGNPMDDLNPPFDYVLLADPLYDSCVLQNFDVGISLAIVAAIFRKHSPHCCKHC
jgi:predicted nicotinamide N-methyase